MSNADELHDIVRARGYEPAEQYDRVQQLDTIREQRRRYAGDTDVMAILDMAEDLEAELRKIRPDIADHSELVTDVLLMVAGHLGTLAILGAPSHLITNIVAVLGERIYGGAK